ncbi:hypothetical protein Tco_0993787 [Tanacetum coccineum]
MMMDPFTKNALWDYWKKGDDQEVLTNEAFSDLKETYEDEIAKIFRIETGLFDFKTPLCMAFNEFNYLLKIDTDLFTHDIQGAKTYEEYENEWLNKDVPWVLKEPRSENGVPYELINHICDSFCYKDVNTKLPTCCSNEDGFCNGGELPRMVRVGYMAYFQDYEWYDNLMDDNLKEEALKQKAINERSWGDATQRVMNFCSWLKRCFENFHELNYELMVKLKEYWWRVNDHECSPFNNWRDHISGTYANANIDAKKPNDDHGIDNFDNDLVWDNTPYHASKEGEQYEEDRYELLRNPYQEPPVCKIGRMEVIKYSFGPAEKCIAIK